MNALNLTRARTFRRSLMAMACAAAATPAFSQTAAPAAAASAPETEAQQVVVSGSRIKHDAFSSPAPIQVIRADDQALSGLTTVSQILQSTAVTGGQSQINNSYGGYVTDGGPGANTIGLRGLAPSRTLVLLNGRRLSPSGTRGSVGAPDLNTLPASIVDRVEILKDGASSIYGSDAVAGVINIITKRDLTQIQVDAGTSQTVHGGGNQYDFSMSGGMVTDHAHFLAAYTFEEQQQLSLRQRGWTQCNSDYTRKVGSDGTVGAWGSGDFVDPLTGKPKCYPITTTGDNGVTINTIGTSQMVGVAGPGTTPVAKGYTRWRPNSGITQTQAGANGLAGYEGVSLASRDTFDPRTLNQSLMSPVKNHNVFLQGGIDLPALGDTTELYWEAMFNRRESSQVGYRQLSLDYAKGSPLIPDNLAFSTALPAGSSAVTNGAPTGVRAFIGDGNDLSTQAVNFTRYVAGLRGTLPKINWDYDVSLTHSESRGTYSSSGYLIDRMTQSLNVVSNGAGGFNCVDPSNGCVAAPALTSALVGGKVPTAWRDWVSDPAITGLTKYKEDVLTASTTGDIYTLPYGKIKGAFGAEFRRNFINDTPADDFQNGNVLNYTSATQTRGADQAKDIFGEVEVPLLKDLPGVHELTVNGSVRRADYKSYGSGVTHKFGALYSPLKWLSVRGTMGTSYRAPALFEQYVGNTTGFLAPDGDPCTDYDQVGGQLATNCASVGVPTGFESTNPITDVTVGGKQAGLKAETSKNNSWGIILQPTLPTGWGDFQFSFDHYNIAISNGIQQVGAANILQLCYDSPTFDPNGGYCRFVHRDPTSLALTVTDSYINVATNLTRGNDYEMEYNNTVGIGKLRVHLEASQYMIQAQRLFPGDPYTDYNGTIGTPKWSGVLDLNYTVKNWSAHWGTEFVGKTNSYGFFGEDAGSSIYLMKTPDYFLHSLSVSYEEPVSKWKATIGVRNLLDRNPPSISAAPGTYNRVGNAPQYSGYDFFGRTVFGSISKTF